MTANTIDARQREQNQNSEEQPAALFSESDRNDLRRRWESIQAGFVDEPRTAVKKADELVDSAIHQLTEMYATERGRLESSWDRGEQASTEDLRLTLRRYRSFFDRLLSV